MGPLPEREREQSDSATRQVLAVGLVVGLCIMGDSFMYGVLPLEARRLGIALPLVGVLLSANRLVRLVSNTWVTGLFARWGSRLPFLLAVLLSAITTGLYGAGWGFAVFLLARLGWGIAWSGLRQAGYQAVWMGSSGIRGRLTGLLWGVVRLGSALGVVTGGFLRDRFGYESAIALLTVLALLSLAVAGRIRWPDAHESDRPRGAGLSWRDWREEVMVGSRRWLLATGILAQILGATVVSTTSLFLDSRMPPDSRILAWLGIGALAGFVLAVRWTAGFFVGPAIGALSDRLGQLPTLNALAVALLGAVLGALFLPAGWALPCMALVMLADAGVFVTLDATASHLAHITARPHLFMGIYATAMDAGSAMGPLIAYLLVGGIPFGQIYLSLSLPFVLVVWWWRRAHRTV